jgi:hypothetical protein
MIDHNLHHVLLIQTLLMREKLPYRVIVTW